MRHCARRTGKKNCNEGCDRMSDFIDNMNKARSPFRTPATSLDQANAYAIHDLAHPKNDSGAAGGGLGPLILVVFIAPFALVALAGAAIAGLLIWVAQRLLAGRDASFDNCFIIAFLGIFAIAVGAFLVALVVNVAGSIWPAAADLAHGVDVEMTRVIMANPLLRNVAQFVNAGITRGAIGAAPLPLLPGLIVKAVLYTPGLLVFAWLIGRGVELGVRGAPRWLLALAAACALTLVSLPLAGWSIAWLAPHSALAPVFAADEITGLAPTLFGAGAVIVIGALLFAVLAPLMARLVDRRRGVSVTGLAAGLLGFALYALLTISVMVMFRHGDALVQWAAAAIQQANPVTAALTTLPALFAALGGYLLVQLPGVLALGRVLGSYVHGTRGALPYAITSLGGQAIALVAVPVGLLAGFALYRAS
jgi:hypothetical protein